MRLEVLLSTMYQNNFDIVEKCNIRTDAIIVNQCNEEKIIKKEYPFGTVTMICSRTRGLSKSRNIALKNSSADICLLCDDDIYYHSNYEEIVCQAFENNLDADLIVFNIISKNTEVRPQEKLFKKIKRIPFYKSYSSVHIAFRRERIMSNNIKFNIKFGTGSGVYSFAEDSLFFSDVHKKHMNSFTYPAVIADLYSIESSWFKGFNKKYFFDTGAYLAAGMPKLMHVFKYYYPCRLVRKTDLSIFQIIHYINKGIYGYKNQLSYFDICKEKDER